MDEEAGAGRRHGAAHYLANAHYCQGHREDWSCIEWHRDREARVREDLFGAKET